MDGMDTSKVTFPDIRGRNRNGKGDTPIGTITKEQHERVFGGMVMDCGHHKRSSIWVNGNRKCLICSDEV